MTSPMIRLLGSVEVVSPTGRAVLTGSRQPAIVGLLALRAGEVVSCDALIDALWGAHPPRTALRSLHSHVSRVRLALSEIGLPDAIGTRDPGYVLTLPRTEVDALVFTDLVTGSRGRDDALETLRRALGLWRGEVMQDCRPVEWGAGETALLTEARYAALEDRWHLEITAGHAAEAVGELERLVAEQPLREPLWELLMSALRQLGRRGDALAVYHRARTVLVDELGVEPGPALRAHQADLLAEEPEPPVGPERTGVPRQLPALPEHFAGREAELATLAGATGRLLVIAGPPGQGKTALAVTYAHRVAGQFGDGQVFVDLRGYDPDAALRPQDILVHVLRALGVPPERLTVGVRDLSALYQATLADRRLLVVLDNAGSADQVAPLVPAAGATRVVVTTRNRLTSLLIDHPARFLALESLDDRAADEMLRLIVGTERVEREPAAATQLVRFCGNLPLALRIAAARLALRPPLMLRHLVAELADEAERLTALEAEDPGRGIRAAFAWSYRGLPATLARVFRLLAGNPGASICLPAVAALTGLTTTQARRAVDGLAAAHLIREVASERYAFHDLIRLFALERLRAEESPADRDAALTRLVEWYTGLTAAGSRILRPYRDRMPPARPLSSHDLPFAPEPAAVLEFFDQEHHNLIPLVRAAGRAGHDLLVAQLAYHAHTFCRYRYTADLLDLASAFQTAAERLGDPATEVIALTDLGSCYRLLRRHDEALPHLWRAVELSRRIGDAREEANALNSIGVLHADRHEYEQALEPYQRALPLLRAIGNTMAQGMVLNNIGFAEAHLGRFASAQESLRAALALCVEIGDLARQGIVHDSLGTAYQAAGDHVRALDHLRQALELKRAGGDLRAQVSTLARIGAVHLALGGVPEARQVLELALRLTRELADPHGEAAAVSALGEVHLRLGELGKATAFLNAAGTLLARSPDDQQQGLLQRRREQLRAAFSRPLAAGTRPQQSHNHPAVPLAGALN